VIIRAQPVRNAPEISVIPKWLIEGNYVFRLSASEAVVFAEKLRRPWLQILCKVVVIGD